MKLNKKQILNDNTMSIGFRRWFCLPERIKKSFEIALMIKNNLSLNIHSEACSFFENMTDLEYITYVKTH